MNIIGRHQKCRSRDNCEGPGCTIRTGKTARKANHTRPHFNKNEGTRTVAKGKK